MQVPHAVNHVSLDYQVAAFDLLDQMEAMNLTQQEVSVSAEPGIMCEEWAGASRWLGSPGNRRGSGGSIGGGDGGGSWPPYRWRVVDMEAEEGEPGGRHCLVGRGAVHEIGGVGPISDRAFQPTAWEHDATNVEEDVALVPPVAMAQCMSHGH